jgi:hypothetical protein
MFDPSMLDYAANIAATDEAARWGHQRGLPLEADAFRLPSWACEFDSRHPLHSESPSQIPSVPRALGRVADSA